MKNEDIKEQSESKVKEASKADIQISDVIAWTTTHKMFISLSVFVCLVLGFLYAGRSQQIFQRESSVMIRSDSYGNSQIGELAAFSDLNLFNTGIDVYNEIEAFRSPILMERIVERLGINTTYTSKNWIGRVTDWYDETPLVVKFVEPISKYDGEAVTSFSFALSSDDDKNFSVGDIKINGKPCRSTAEITVGVAAKTPVGTIVVSPTKFYKDNFSGTLYVDHTTVKNCAKAKIKSLESSLSDKKSTVINFSFTDSNAKRAEDILNTLLDVYNEEWIRYMNESTDNTSKFINERLVVIEEELGLVDSDIEKFKSSNRLLDIGTETTRVSEASVKYSDEAFRVNNQLSIARFIREYLVDKTKTLDLLPANSGINNDNIELQIAEYNKKLLERQRLADSSSDSNPLVSDLNNQLAMMRQTVLHSVDNLISTLKIQAQRINDRENQIEGQISSNPGKVKQLLSIERQQKIKEELYLYLLQKREENELTASIVVNNTRLLKPATGETAPIAPKKGFIMLVALMLGVAIPFGYMYLSSIIDTSVRGRKDVETLSAPIVGEIPQDGKKTLNIPVKLRLRKPKDEIVQVVVRQRSRNVINEAFRVVRTNLDFMLNNSAETQAIMMTSYNPGSGKTFTSLNIATSMALKGKHVMLIDLDIRKATLSKTIGEPRKGITNYLNGQIDYEQAVVHNMLGTEGLDFLPVGVIPPNPAELLLDKRLETLIAEVKQHYDYIFIDCPPVGIVADTSIISRVADRTIFVIRVGVLDRRVLPDIERVYKEQQYPNMSLLINGSKQALGYGYSRYSYGYGRYGYGYGGYGYHEEGDGK